MRQRLINSRVRTGGVDTRSSTTWIPGRALVVVPTSSARECVSSVTTATVRSGRVHTSAGAARISSRALVVVLTRPTRESVPTSATASETVDFQTM